MHKCRCSIDQSIGLFWGGIGLGVVYMRLVLVLASSQTRRLGRFSGAPYLPYHSALMISRSALSAQQDMEPQRLITPTSSIASNL